MTFLAKKILGLKSKNIQKEKEKENCKIAQFNKISKKSFLDEKLAARRNLPVYH